MRRIPCVLALAGLPAVLVTLLASPGLRAQSPAPIDASALYKKHCLMCHMADGNNKAVKNANFIDGVWVHGSSVEEVATVIRNGVKGTAMVSFAKKLSDAEIQALARHVRTFDKTLKPADAQ